MACPFTGRKMFCMGPNFLSQPKNLRAFSVSSKTCIQKNWFLSQPKFFEGALNAVKFLGWLKKLGPAQNILGPVKGQGINRTIFSHSRSEQFW